MSLGPALARGSLSCWTGTVRPRAGLSPCNVRIGLSERTKMGRRREANADTSSAFYQDRRKAIVDEAARAFQERGYEATTFGLIAHRLNTDRASLYYYFGSKQDLFREVVREVAQETVETAEAVAAM